MARTATATARTGAARTAAASDGEDGDGDGEDGDGDGEDGDGEDGEAEELDGEGEDADGDGDGDGGDEDTGDEDTDDDDGWRETSFTAAAGWLGTVGLCKPVAARAEPAVTTTIAIPTAMAALTPLICRRRKIQCTVKPCTAGGEPDGHSAASKSAASPRCDRPRSRQSGP